ncbi:MAG TPA: hypothetical protein VGG06_22845 [Thermoanaerobaculia bacterium]|jgi:hypothetical protein
MLHPKLLRRFTILCALLLVATPACGYVVILKDGTQIITREKYRREGDRVFLVLQSGTKTFIAASEIDFAKTDELNKENLGLVKVIETGDTVVEEAPPPEQKPTLRDLVGESRLSLPEVAEEDRGGEGAPPLTRAGFMDLWSVKTRSHPDLELADEVSRYLAGQGVEGFRVLQGTAERRLLLQLTASSEVAVFKGLREAAAAFVQAQSRYPDRIAALELVMSTEAQKRAGQFVLTRELADQLLAGAVDPPTFFYRHVQF